jgi:ATP-dependent protease ClpP protease subunit
MKGMNMIENRNGMLTKINEHFFPDQEDIDQAYIYLKGDITVESCADVIEQIIGINYPTYTEDDEGFQVEEPLPDVINLLITSVGGDMTAAFSLINVMRGSRIPVRTIVLGEASSAGLCITMAGHQRVATPYSSLMSHSFSTGVEGSYADLVNAVKAMDEYYKKMLRFYIECTGLDTKFIKKHLLTSKDHHFDPETALKYNMIDFVSDLQ